MNTRLTAPTAPTAPITPITPTALIALVLSFLPASLGAQKGFEAKLVPAADVILAGTNAVMILTVDVTATTKLPLALLSGYNFKTTVDGKSGPMLSERVSGTVTVAAGTKIERRIPVDLARVAPNLKPNGLTRVSFEWSGIKGLSAVVSIAPDLRQVDVDKLDLKHTKVLLVTNYGQMLVKFFPEKAPKTVKNFVKLAKDGFYDGTQFHRVIRGFMIQGGCPNTKKGATGRPGTGGPPGNYTIKDEFHDTRHDKGILSMANTGVPNSAGCQFFIMHRANSQLDGKYTVFGELVTGEDTLDKIANVPVGGPQGSTPKKPVHLTVAIVQPAFKKK